MLQIILYTGRTTQPSLHAAGTYVRQKQMWVSVRFPTALILAVTDRL